MANDAETPFNFNFLATALKLERGDDGASLDTSIDLGNAAAFEDVFFNLGPNYFNAANNDFRIGPDSGFILKGNPLGTSIAPLDIEGTVRPMAPDLGAYQAQALPEEL